MEICAFWAIAPNIIVHGGGGDGDDDDEGEEEEEEDEESELSLRRKTNVLASTDDIFVLSVGSLVYAALYFMYWREGEGSAW